MRQPLHLQAVLCWAGLGWAGLARAGLGWLCCVNVLLAVMLCRTVAWPQCEVLLLMSRRSIKHRVFSQIYFAAGLSSTYHSVTVAVMNSTERSELFQFKYSWVPCHAC